jgi:hypothetical protein
MLPREVRDGHKRVNLFLNFWINIYFSAFILPWAISLAFLRVRPYTKKVKIVFYLK